MGVYDRILYIDLCSQSHLVGQVLAAAVVVE